MAAGRIAAALPSAYAVGAMSATPIPVLRILAGTAAAVRLAEAAAARFDHRLEVAASLAGITTVPRGCRVDAIGAVSSGLADAAAVIDGLDPFDHEAVRAIREAAQRAGLPRLAFRQPVWHRHPLDRWIEVRNLAGAVGAVTAVARTVLLSLPERDLMPFEAVDGLRFPARLTRRPARWDRPARFTLQYCPPPFSLQAEIRLLRGAGARAIVMRATGADEDLPLLQAARSLDLPVVMIRRPAERGEVPARSIEVALDWVVATLAGANAAAKGVPAWR